MTTHNPREWEERFDERFIPNDGGIPTYIENGNDLKEFIHQELQKARVENYALAVKHLKEVYESNGATTVPEVIEWLEDNVRLYQSELDQVPEQFPKVPELSEPSTRELLDIFRNMNQIDITFISLLFFVTWLLIAVT
jgi:ABC-type multidrug transport system ATPase subunit